MVCNQKPTKRKVVEREMKKMHDIIRCKLRLARLIIVNFRPAEIENPFYRVMSRVYQGLINVFCPKSR